MSDYSTQNNQNSSIIQTVFFNAVPYNQLGGLHRIAVGLYGLVLFLSFLFGSPWVLGIGYAVFFLVTSYMLLKKMIIFSIVASIIVAIFPPVGILIALVLIVFLFMRIQYIMKHWRPIVAGAFIYGAAFVYIQLLLYPMYFIYSKTDTFVIGLVMGMAGVIILNGLLQWLYSHNYDARLALGIMGSVPLVVASIVLPFMKVYVDAHGVGEAPVTDVAHSSGSVGHAPAVDATHGVQGPKLGGMSSASFAGAKIGTSESHGWVEPGQHVPIPVKISKMSTSQYDLETKPQMLHQHATMLTSESGAHQSFMQTADNHYVSSVKSIEQHSEVADDMHQTPSFEHVPDPFNQQQSIVHPTYSSHPPAADSIMLQSPGDYANLYGSNVNQPNFFHAALALSKSKILGDFDKPHILVGSDGFPKMHIKPVGDNHLIFQDPQGNHIGEAHINSASQDVHFSGANRISEFRIESTSGAVLDQTNMQVGTLKHIGTKSVLMGTDGKQVCSLDGAGNMKNAQGWPIASLHSV